MQIRLPKISPTNSLQIPKIFPYICRYPRFSHTVFADTKDFPPTVSADTNDFPLQSLQIPKIFPYSLCRYPRFSPTNSLCRYPRFSLQSLQIPKISPYNYCRYQRFPPTNSLFRLRSLQIPKISPTNNLCQIPKIFHYKQSLQIPKMFSLVFANTIDFPLQTVSADTRHCGSRYLAARRVSLSSREMKKTNIQKTGTWEMSFGARSLPSTLRSVAIYRSAPIITEDCVSV